MKRLAIAALIPVALGFGACLLLALVFGGDDPRTMEHYYHE